MPKFSLIFIVKDSAELISCALYSVELLQYDTNAFEVIVVDDGSDIPIQSSIQKTFGFNISMIYAPRIEGVSSRARARNLGANAAKGQYLIFVDGDHFVAPDFLQQYERYFTESPDRCVVLGKRHHILQQHYDEIINTIKCGSFELELSQEHYSLDERDFILRNINTPFSELLGRWYLFWSCNFCIKKNVFSEIGGFDENFIEWGVEDTEFGYRLLSHGYEFTIIDNYVWHFLQAQPITERKYQGWLHNIQYFYHKYEDFRILEQMTFDTLLFQNAFMPNKKQKDMVELFVEFEQKLRHLESVDFPHRYTRKEHE